MNRNVDLGVWDLPSTARSGRKVAFTLAEVLITLGIIGVVAAMTLPTVLANIQERVRNEQVRTIKYKLTQATDKMKSLDLIGRYGTEQTATEEFVNELKNHFKIAKVCNSDNISGCWPTSTINTADGTVSVSSLTTGSAIKALGLGTASTKTVGIVTGDGVPMILTYSPKCTPMDSAKTYAWSMVDYKPETNATTNCISAIFDINGSHAPNKVGTDVRTLNSLFGYKQLSATALSESDCKKYKDKIGIKYCRSGGSDYFAGAAKACYDLGLHLPSLQTLATIAGARYGRTDIGPYTSITINSFTNSSYPTSTGNCEDYYRAVGSYRLTDGEVICVAGNSIPSDSSAGVSVNGFFWSSSELSASQALRRYISSDSSSWYRDYRSNHDLVPLCVGD